MSKILQILRLQCQISKVFSRSLEQLFLTAGQNDFGNKIPFQMEHIEIEKQFHIFLLLKEDVGAKA